MRRPTLDELREKDERYRDRRGGNPYAENIEKGLLRKQKEMLRNRFVGKRVRWATAEKNTRRRGIGGKHYMRKRPLENGEGVVRDVRIHHGQIFYFLEGRDEGIARHALDEFEVLETQNE